MTSDTVSAEQDAGEFYCDNNHNRFTMTILLMLICAVMAVRSKRPLSAAMWLAGVSALAALQLFSMEAYRIAVIELSVGGGLVTVLLVFAITLTGDSAPERSHTVPRGLALTLALVPAVLLGAMVLTRQTAVAPGGVPGAVPVPRDLDLLLQVLLIFAGGLTVLSLIPAQAATHPAVESLPLEEITPLEEREVA
jgi:uncharacterized MnhB-related membrane protein